ncbi:structural protein [Pseudaeromonas phage vB_PpeM_ KLEP7]|nr:structural protein [Pseudaeromonas phage vB_PpeM_ KLEP7]
MAEKKVVGRLVNTVSFQTDRASLQKALADIKKVKDAMRGITLPTQKIRQQTTALKQFNRTKEEGIKSDLRMNRLHNRALAENARRDRVTSQNAAKVSARRMDTIKADRFGLTNRFGSSSGRGFDKIANQFSSGAISARMYRQQVSALRRDLSSAANAQRGFNGTLKDMRSAFVQATASYTAFAGISGAANIGKQYEARQAGMLVGTGDPEKARKQIAFLDKEIYRLGLDQQVASQGFVQMSVAAKGVLSEGDLQALFKGLGELSTAVQLDPFRFEKTILAISQVMNKTQLMSEEIKSQLNPI